MKAAPIPTDKRLLAQARKLRDAALRIREVVEGWEPERRIMVVHSGAFRISYREPGLLLPLGKAARNTKPPAGLPYGLTITTDTKLLDMEWDDESTALNCFHRGAWEEAFTRLAAPPKTARRGLGTSQKTRMPSRSGARS
jgi:hypothetical protein